MAAKLSCMNRCYHLAGILFMTAISLTACHKYELQTVSTYSFTNATGARITFDIYGSKADYNNNRNVTAKYYMEPGATQTISLNVLQTYWIDWYTSDYLFNNWAISDNGTTSFAPFPNPILRLPARMITSMSAAKQVIFPDQYCLTEMIF